MMNQHEHETQQKPQETHPTQLVKPLILAIVVAIIVLLGIVAARSGILASGQWGLPEPTATRPPTPTGPIARQAAEAGVTSNADWSPYTEVINGIEMALVPAGCFQMGSTDGDDDEPPVHEVCFDQPFWIDVYEVTNEQYGEAAPECMPHSSEPAQPRICINWDNAKAHCESRGARLPTEAEWEYAARGPDSLAYPWGNDFIADNVVYQDNAGGRTWAVGSKPGGVSWVGAYDSLGNVWEWVNDWYGSEYYGTLADGVVNPQGPNSGDNRVLRGSSWFLQGANARATNRYGNFPLYKIFDVGFRCALSYQP